MKTKATHYFHRSAKAALMGLFILSISACSTVGALFDQDGVDYKSSKAAQKLEVPPDLTQIRATDRFSAGRSVSASTVGVVATNNNQVLPQSSTARIERAGNSRYLVVNLPAEQVFPILVSFWKDIGFTLAIESPQTGIVETDWAENRAKVVSSGLRKVLGGVFDSLFDSGERDKYRTRIERVGNSSEIYLSHRGTKEVVTNNRANTEVNTVSRDGSIELEAEFLRRLLLKFTDAPSTAVANSGAPLQAAPAPDRARLIPGKDALELDDNFDTAWRRVGLALDRSGFTIEDKNYSTGEYFIRYARTVGENDVGFFSRVFTNEKERRAASKQLKLLVQRSNPTVMLVQANNGAPAEADITKNMLTVMRDELR